MAKLKDLAHVIRRYAIDDALRQFGDCLGREVVPDGLVEVAQFQFDAAEFFGQPDGNRFHEELARVRGDRRSP